MRLRISLTRLLALALGLLAAAGTAEAQTKRFALVLGSSAYRHVVDLPNAANDARLMASRLRELGFDVTSAIDADGAGLASALATFGSRLATSPGVGVALVYYAGHGLRIEGVNHLVGTDSRPTGQTDIATGLLSANEITATLAAARARLNIVILDACRNNPFAGRGASGNGLAEMEAPVDTLIAFATAPGKIAADGPTGANSPYTSHLARLMNTPNLSLGELFRRLTSDVYAATRGGQTPWINSSLRREFYFRGECGGELPMTDEQTCRQFMRTAPVRALPHCAAAVAADPESGLGWGRLGIVSRRSGRHDEAEAAFKRSIEIGEQRNETNIVQSGMFELADLYWAQRKVGQSNALFTSLLARCEATRTTNCIAGVRVSLGQISVNRGNLDEAARHCEAGLMLNTALAARSERRNSIARAHECLAAVESRRRNLAAWCNHKTKARNLYAALGDVTSTRRVEDEQARAQCKA
jgi:tetratricopeptide (TPR) repeat protein